MVMKKIFSLMMVIAAVAMVSCCGNANQKKAECCPEAAAPAEEAPAAVPAQ